MYPDKNSKKGWYELHIKSFGDQSFMIVSYWDGSGFASEIRPKKKIREDDYIPYGPENMISCRFLGEKNG
jgi:hypothetical protein